MRAAAGIADPDDIGNRLPGGVAHAAADGVDDGAAAQAEGQRKGSAGLAQRLGRGGEKTGILRRQLFEQSGEAWRAVEAQDRDETGRIAFGAVADAPAEGSGRCRLDQRRGLGERGSLRRPGARVLGEMPARGEKESRHDGKRDERDGGERSGGDRGSVEGGGGARAQPRGGGERQTMNRRPTGSPVEESPPPHRSSP